jgi:uncharacterized membrane protein YGL010W
MTLIEQLTNYARYHRDRRNVATHFVGVPMIVVAVATLLSRPSVELAGVPVSAAFLVSAGAILFYAVLDLRFAAVMAALFGGSVALGAYFASLSTAAWLIAGLGGFFVGWAIQFIGHFYEGAKPAFVDDLRGLLVGPLFLVAEVAFAVGLRSDVGAAVEAEAGPMRSGPRPEARERAYE